MKICVGGRFFDSKKTAKLHIRAVLVKQVGRDIGAGHEHYGLVSGLWERSLHYRPGVSHFEVVEKLGGIGIRAIVDNLYFDFSVRESISGHSVSHWQKLTSAFRGSIRPQIREFKAGNDKRCALCDCSGFLEADHVVRFRDLMRSFIAGRQVPREFDYCSDGYKFTKQDLDFQAEWLAFHLEHCSLRLLCSGCHAKHTASQRQRSDSESSD